MPGWAESGLCQDRHACPGGAPDGNGAEHGERLPPPSRGNTEICKDKGHIIPSTSRRKRKQQPNEKADNGRAHDGEDVLRDHQCEAGRNEANKDGTEWTCSGLIGMDPGSHADEERQRVDSEREQCPTEDTEPDNIEKNADDDHGDGSRDKGCKGRAFHHHHHGAGQGIADAARVWNPLRSSFRQQQAMRESSPAPLRWIPTLDGGADVSPLPAFETAIRKAGFSMVVS